MPLPKPYYQDDAVTIYHGDCRSTLRGMGAETIHTCVTSPPYWRLRDYGVDGQFGLERTPEEYVARMVDTFREVRRVLREDGTLWLNIGDSYSNVGKHGGQCGGMHASALHGYSKTRFKKNFNPWLHIKPKDLVGIPWIVAFALRQDGWYLRQDIIWAKPNPMPESVTDRCTKSHEYIFMLSKSKKYYYDAEAIKEPASLSSVKRWAQNIEQQEGSHRVPGKTNGTMKAVGGPKSDKQRGHGRRHAGFNARWDAMSKSEQCSGTRNKRSVWTVSTKPFKGAHFATFPPDLIVPCILAGCPRGGTVLDPFMGAGTTALVAKEHGRKAIGSELNAEYIEIAAKRMAQGVLL